MRPGRNRLLLLWAPAFLALVLLLDRSVSRDGQLVLGAATWAALVSATALMRGQAARVAVVVVVATFFELIGSIVWGVYTYRLGNLPSFVPPAHGLVYLSGLAVSELSPVKRAPRFFVVSVCSGACCWAALGLSGVLGRTDAVGAFGVLVFVALVRTSPAPAMLCGVFLVVAALELYGTRLGTWTWAARVPGLGLPDGNPPSGAASGYGLFDVAAVALAPMLAGLGSRLRASARARRPRALPGAAGVGAEPATGPARAC